MPKNEYFYGDEIHLDLEEYEVTQAIFSRNNIRLFVNWGMYRLPNFIGSKNSDPENYYFNTLCEALKWAEENQEIN